MKKITAFLTAVAAAAFLVLGAAIPTIKAYALFSSPEAVLVVNDSGNTASGGTELSIPENIGTEIPQAEKSIPIIGIIMWALVAVAIITALIVMFANLGDTDISVDVSVRRKRYRKKQPRKSKLLGDRYYRK